MLFVDTVQQYQYLLPSGWSVNGSTSNGSSWIVASNHEVVTPDAVTGNGGAVSIRPSNIGCSTGLATGPQANIPISRTQPTVYTTATNICDNPSGYSFDLTNAPSGSSVTWTSSSNISIPSASGTSITAYRNSSLNTAGFVKANVTLACSATPIEVTYPINVGLVTPYFDIFAANGHCQGDFYEAIAASGNGAGVYSYNWYINSSLDSYHGYKIRRYFPSNYTEIKLNIQTADCTIPSDDFTLSWSCESLMFRMSPNPATTSATIESKHGNGFTRIRIFDKLGNLKAEHKYSTLSKKTTISIAYLPADIYTIQVFDGKEWTSTQFVKN